MATKSFWEVIGEAVEIMIACAYLTLQSVHGFKFYRLIAAEVNL